MTLGPCRMFIRTLNIREIGVIERLLLSFFLPGFAGDVLNSYALSCVYHHALGQTGNFRCVKDADEVVMDFKALRPAFACSLGLIDNDFFYQLIEDRRGQLLNIGVLFHRLEETCGAVLAFFLRVYLRLQGGDFLFQRNLFIVIPLGNHHKPLVRKFAAGVVLVGFGEKTVQLGTSGQQPQFVPKSRIVGSTSFPHTSQPGGVCLANSSTRGRSPMRATILSRASSGFLLWASMGEIINWWTLAACRLGWPRVASRQISAFPCVQKPSP